MVAINLYFHRKPNSFVGYVNVKVKDLDHSLTFYQGILDVQICNKLIKQLD